MRLYADRVLLSATDLNTFLGCAHASVLDFRRSILGQPLEPMAEDEGQKLVQRRGAEHEQAYFEALRASASGEVVWVQDRALDQALHLTAGAMVRGAPLSIRGPWLTVRIGTAIPTSWSVS